MRDGARSYPAKGLIQRQLEALADAGRIAAIFEMVARKWFDRVKGQWAKVHASDVIRSLERDVFPHIGNWPIADLKPPKILEVLRAIEDRPALETAKRVGLVTALRKAEAVGRPVGSKQWLADMEKRTGNVRIPARRGPAPRPQRQ